MPDTHEASEAPEQEAPETPKRKRASKARKRKRRKKGKPRPPTLTQAVREAIVESVRAGASITTACLAAGTARSNYYHWRDMGQKGRAPYKGFLAELEQAKRLFETEHVKVVNNAAFDGDWKASAWLLERHPRTRKRWRGQQRVEHTGADGGPIQAAGVPMLAIEEALAAVRANETPRITELEAEVERLRAQLPAEDPSG
jgi:hypothetical protein